MEGLLFIIFMPVALILSFVLVWLLLAKLLAPLLNLLYRKVISVLPVSEKKNDDTIKLYEQSNELKGLMLFFIIFATYCALTGNHGFRGPASTYIMLILVWATFLFQIYKIEIIEDKIIIFHRVAKNSKVNIEDIESFVEGLRYYRLYHKNGVLHLDYFIPNIETFKSTIISLNPNIKTESISLNNFYRDWWGYGYLFHFILIGLVFVFMLYLIGSHLVSTVW